MAPQATPSRITIREPSASLASTVVYIPEVHSKLIGNYFPELGRGDTTKATIVADIASAQHDEVRRVFAFDIAAGKCWDASKEIAQAVLEAVLTDHSQVPAWCIDFVEEHLGLRWVAQAQREAA